MSLDIGYLKHKRRYLRKQVTEIYNDVCTNLVSYDKTKILNIRSKLNQIAPGLEVYDEQINCALWDSARDSSINEENLNQALAECESYSDKVLDCLTYLEEALKETNNASPTVSTHSYNEPTSRRLKPRVAPLPTYSGNSNESLEKFIYNFESVLGNVDYSEYEKFILLKENLFGRAASLINSLELCRQSYTEAKSLLEEAFASKEIQISETISKLVNLKFEKYCDPLLFVSEWRAIKESISTLHIDMNMVIQHHLWNSFNKELKEVFIHISNENFPSLESLESNLFKGLERYKVIGAGKNFEKRRTNIMTSSTEIENMSQIKKTCLLCNEGHAYFVCQKYRTPAEKLKRIKELGGCERCAYLNHKSSQCKLKLVCKLCQGPHFPCLCLKLNEPKKKVTFKDTKTEKINLVSYDNAALKTSFEAGVALPTITGKIEGKDIRIMKDTGSQSNFIDADFAKNCNLKVVRRNFELTINGFNAAKRCVTNVVKVPLNISNNIYHVNAICVPNLSIKLELPEIGRVVHLLNILKYDVADTKLNSKSESISDIQFILGSEYSYVLPVCTKIVKPYGKSSLLETSHGVMVEGNLSQLCEDLMAVCNSDCVEEGVCGTAHIASIMIDDSSNLILKF